MDNATVSLTLARALLDDPEQDWATDDYLRPFLNLAYRALAMQLGAYRIPFDDRVVIVPSVPAGTTDLGAFIQPGGPLAAMWQPVDLFERASGGDDTQWRPMSRVSDLPPSGPQAYYEFWEYREGNICFPPSNQVLDLRVRFEEIFPALAAPGDPIRIIGGAQALAYSAASLASRSRGNRDLAVDLDALAQRECQTMALRLVQESQNVTRRQRPFRADWSHGVVPV